MFDRAVKRASLSTFIFADDLSGRTVAWAAIRAARRGVTTSILIDGLDVRTEGRGDRVTKGGTTRKSVSSDSPPLPKRVVTKPTAPVQDL